MTPADEHDTTTDLAAPDANVARLMVDLVDRVADKPAFIRLDEQGRTDQVITFARLHQLVGAVAGGLRERGIGRGSRVVVFVPMSIELYVTLLAVLRLGAVATFIEPWGGRKMIEQAAKLVDADAFIGIPKSFVLRLMSPALRGIDVAITTGSRRIPGAERFSDLLATPRFQHVLDSERMGADEPALVTFTTGSTGTPKGTNRTHEILLAQHHALARQVPDAEHARVWTNLPVVVLHNIGRGVETVLPPDKVGQDPMPDPKQFHNLVEQSGATILALSPAPLGQLGRAPGRAPLTKVERVYTGGGPVTPELLDAARAVLPNAQITALYGSTEAEPIAHATAEEVLARRGAMRAHGGIYVGREVDDVDLLIVRPERGAIELEQGTSLQDWAVVDGAPGEVLVAGDHVNREYWRNPQAVRENKVVDENGRVWHRTGDIARRAEDGGLWLLGRRGGGFTMKGRRWWSLEIETPVTDLPEVERAAICMPKFTGSDREFKNATAVLAVEPAQGFDRRDATAATVRVLADLGLAAHIEVRSLKKIPVDKRHATKIDVAALQEQLKPENREDY
ncbi:MAG: AMP-binding protein [Thermoleophilia bacterium]|nr:AMP-binding protein [Thermoleophilia bacterium]